MAENRDVETGVTMVSQDRAEPSDVQMPVSYRIPLDVINTHRQIVNTSNLSKTLKKWLNGKPKRAKK